MKKLVIALIVLTGINLGAQPFKKNKRHPNLTSDQIAILQTKKMTLNLGLTESQQQKILQINKKNAVERAQKIEERKAMIIKGERPDSEKIFKRKSERLDKQIAHQNELKSILNEQQFETWKKSKAFRNRQMKKRAYQKHLNRQCRG